MSDDEIEDVILPSNINDRAYHHTRRSFRQHNSQTQDRIARKLNAALEKCRINRENEEKERNAYLRQLSARSTPISAPVAMSLDGATPETTSRLSDLHITDSISEQYQQSLPFNSGQTNNEGEGQVNQEGPFVSTANNEKQETESQLISNCDHALEALESIAMHGRDAVKVVRLPSAEATPRYDAWVPVINNFFVDESGVDPYLPYFGSGRRNMEAADNCFQQMLSDERLRAGRSSFDELSDGEVCEGGDIIGPRTIEDWYRFRSPANVRKRASIRFAISETVRVFGDSPLIWRSIGYALDIRNQRRLQYIWRVDRERRREIIRKEEELNSLQLSQQKVRRASNTPKNESPIKMTHRDGSAASALKHFCFRCHVFGCRLHEGENVAPVLPIPDHGVEKRLQYIENPDPKKERHYCSQVCIFLPPWRRLPVGPDEEDEWTPEDILLLREAGTLCGMDPCNVAIIVGRTCRQVFYQMRKPEIRTLIRYKRDQQSMPRLTPIKKKSLNSSYTSSGSKGSNGLRKSNASARPNPTKSAVNIETETEDDETTIRYTPCNHPGSCTKQNGCPCAEKNISCEMYCGCHCARFVQGKQGMALDMPTKAELEEGLAIRCSRLATGCHCTTGYCNSDACLCYRSLRVCNPDVCGFCECSELPDGKGKQERRCRNSDAITSTHRRTYVGKSKVHGFGLFAGDNFNKGDLVGIYCGRVMHPDILEETLRVYQAKGMTYAFTLYDSLTVDAGQVGSKAKFLNHNEGDKKNCHARVERLRGDGVIVLKTMKKVRRGEELIFDYQIIGEGGNNWILRSGEMDASSSEGDDSNQSLDEADSDHVELVSSMSHIFQPTNKQPIQQEGLEKQNEHSAS